MKWKDYSLFTQFRTYLALLILAFVLFGLQKIGFLNLVEQGFQFISVPTQIGFHRFTESVGNVVSTAVEIGGLHGRVSELETENAVLKADNARLQGLQAENKSLRTQLNTPISGITIFKAATPIGIGPFGTRSVLLIDKGATDGIKENYLVIYKNILIGRVVAISPKVSSVQLLTDPQTKITAVTTNGSEGIVQGEFGSGISLDNVIQEDPLTKGDLVFTSGKDGLPRGLFLGTVTSVSKQDKEFFQKATLSPLVEAKDLALVFIVKN